MVAALVTPESRSVSRVSPRAFASQRERDDESALMHYRARSYDPRTGRFIQKDPIVEQRVREHYQLASLRPTQWGDPLGEATWDLDALRRRAEENPGARKSYEWWRKAIQPGAEIDQEMQRIFEGLPGVAIWPRTAARIRGEWVEFAAEWSRESRSTLYKRIYSQAEIQVTANTALQAGAAGITPMVGAEALRTDFVSLAGLDFPMGDNPAQVVAFILIHELVHVAQKHRWEPSVDLSDHFSIQEMQARAPLFGMNPQGLVTPEGPEFNTRWEPFAYYLQGQATQHIKESVQKDAGWLWRTNETNASVCGTSLIGGEFRWDLARWREVTSLERGLADKYLRPPSGALGVTKF